MKISWFLLLVVLTVSCIQENNTEIIQMKNIGSIYDCEETGNWYKKEYFVITNPPNDTIGLLELISAFNDSTLSVDSISKYKSGSYYRAFYEETRSFSRDYEEVSGWGSDRIEDHAKKRLLTIRWQESHGSQNLFMISYTSAVLHFSKTYYNISEDELFYNWKLDEQWRE